MEFNEKLQQLRKQRNLTQEQLAEQLYVSRTAISKWESGKGYPNIDSLKAISKLFSVSIDELLSGEELLTLAEEENETNLRKVYSFVLGVLDLVTILFLFLPLYANAKGDYFYSVNLFGFKDTTIYNLVTYWSIFITLILCGFMELLLLHFEKETFRNIVVKISIGVDIFGICFFAAAREPYANAFLFLLFLIKIVLLLKQTKIK